MKRRLKLVDRLASVVRAVPGSVSSSFQSSENESYSSCDDAAAVAKYSSCDGAAAVARYRRNLELGEDDSEPEVLNVAQDVTSVESRAGYQLSMFQKETAARAAARAVSSVTTNPQASFNLDIREWKTFTEQQIFQLCGSNCTNPDYIKIEVVIGWLENSDKPVDYVQTTFDKLLGNTDPDSLSDRYISIIGEYLSATYANKVSLPFNFQPYLNDPSVDDNPTLSSKLISNLWLVREPLRKALSFRGRCSFYTKCFKCPWHNGKQEIVFKLSDGVPCYDLLTDHSRNRVLTETTPLSHYHPSSLLHWVILVGSPLKLVSCVTASRLSVFKTITGTCEKDRVRLVCLQLKCSVSSSTASSSSSLKQPMQ